MYMCCGESAYGMVAVCKKDLTRDKIEDIMCERVIAMMNLE